MERRADEHVRKFARPGADTGSSGDLRPDSGPAASDVVKFRAAYYYSKALMQIDSPGVVYSFPVPKGQLPRKPESLMTVPRDARAAAIRSRPPLTNFISRP